MIKKYAVEDNCWAKLETSIDATATKIRIKETHNLPQSWEWIATLAKKQGDEIIKMEKVLVVKRELNLLTVQRGFQSTAQAWEENDVINLYITAEIIREIQRGFDKKADLIDGKVPKSQIPEISLDESNLVHKSWDEVIGGVKIFENWLIFRNAETDLQIKDLTLSKHDPKETQTISQYAKATNWTPWGIHFVDYVSATPNWLWNRHKELRGYLHIWGGVRTFDHFQTRGYEWFDGTEASLPNAKKYIKLEAPKILLWDDDILWDWKTYTPTVSANWSPTITESFWKYQKIWKTVHCKVKLRVRRNWSYWRFFVSLPVNARDTWEIVDGTSIVWTFWASNSNNYGYITVSNWHAQILWGIWHAGNFGNLSEDVFISFSITYEAL